MTGNLICRKGWKCCCSCWLVDGIIGITFASPQITLNDIRWLLLDSIKYKNTKEKLIVQYYKPICFHGYQSFYFTHNSLLAENFSKCLPSTIGWNWYIGCCDSFSSVLKQITHKNKQGYSNHTTTSVIKMWSQFCSLGS